MITIEDQLRQRVHVLEMRLLHAEASMLKARRESKAGVADRALTAAGRKPKLPVDFKSQYGEDVLLWELLDGQLDGFFVEVGAHDGIFYSISYAFESVGWTGLLVEALPDQAEACRRNRPGSRVVHAACLAPGGPDSVEFTLATHQPVLSYHVTTSQHKAMLERVGGPQQKLTVPATTMNELLKDHQGPIDFAVIDVEGAEYELLRGFDLARFKPRIVLLEDIHPAASSQAQKLMRELPYEHAGPWHINQVYVHKEEKDILRRVGLSKAAILV